MNAKCLWSAIAAAAALAGCAGVNPHVWEVTPEIRAAVADTASARRSLEAAVADLDAARAALSAAEARHAAGVVDGAGLAAARLTVADAEQAVCDARLRLGFAQVALILAEGPA